jgi:hypothetical protein
MVQTNVKEKAVDNYLLTASFLSLLIATLNYLVFGLHLSCHDHR